MKNKRKLKLKKNYFFLLLAPFHCEKLKMPRTTKSVPPRRLSILIGREFLMFENFRLFGNYGYMRQCISKQKHRWRASQNLSPFTTMGGITKVWFFWKNWSFIRYVLFTRAKKIEFRKYFFEGLWNILPMKVVSVLILWVEWAKIDEASKIDTVSKNVYRVRFVI